MGAHGQARTMLSVWVGPLRFPHFFCPRGHVRMRGGRLGRPAGGTHMHVCVYRGSVWCSNLHYFVRDVTRVYNMTLRVSVIDICSLNEGEVAWGAGRVFFFSDNFFEISPVTVNLVTLREILIPLKIFDKSWISSSKIRQHNYSITMCHSILRNFGNNGNIWNEWVRGYMQAKNSTLISNEKSTLLHGRWNIF
jgi:hypothetical protein